MKTLLINQKGYQREECCSGRITNKLLPSQFFIAAQYLLDHGHDIEAVDLQTQQMPDIDDFDNVVVWVSMLEGFYDDISFIKKAKVLGIKTIMILNDPMGCEMDVMHDYSEIDYCIRLYEREIVLEKLLTSLENDSIINYPGIIYRKNNQLIDGGVMPPLKNAEHLGTCSGLLMKLDLTKYQSANIITGKGCPMKCTFCHYSETGARKRKIDDILREFLIIHKHIENIYFLDLNMPADPVWFKAFLQELISINNTKAWKTDMRLDACTPEVLGLLKKAGCTSILIGVESVNQGILDKIQKYVLLSKFDEYYKNIRDAGIEADFTFMIGFPWDNNSTLQEMYDFIKNKRITSFGLGIVMPIKGTKLYMDYKKLGLLLHDLSYKDYVFARFDVPASNTLFISKEQILFWYKKISSLRFRPRYWFEYVRNNGFRFRYIKTLLRL